MTDNTRRIGAYARQAGVLTAYGLPDTGRYQMTPAQVKRMWKKTRHHYATPSRLLANADRVIAREGRATRLEDIARRFLGAGRPRVKITPVPAPPPAGAPPWAGPDAEPAGDMRAVAARHTAMARPQGDR